METTSPTPPAASRQSPSRPQRTRPRALTTGGVRLLAPVWLVGYVIVHAVWAIGDPPRFMNGGESYFPGGWIPVVLGVLAAIGCLAVAATAREKIPDTGHYVLAGLNAVAGVALCVYSFLFPVLVVSLLFAGTEPGITASLLATGSGAAGGVFCLMTAANERRLAAHSCTSCGRVHGRSPESRGEQAPGWAFAGAYLAVAGYAARMSMVLYDTISGRWPSATSQTSGPSSTALVVFIVLMSLAGTLLPLALAHRWGRLWPAWTGPLRTGCAAVVGARHGSVRRGVPDRLLRYRRHDRLDPRRPERAVPAVAAGNGRLHAVGCRAAGGLRVVPRADPATMP
jgi:hypothetical protein